MGKLYTSSGKVLNSIVTLYNGDSEEDITLSDKASNYEDIEIFYKVGTTCEQSIKIHDPQNATDIPLTKVNYSSSASNVRIFTETVSISDDTIKRSTQYIKDIGTSAVQTTSIISITRVIGYNFAH